MRRIARIRTASALLRPRATVPSMSVSNASPRTAPVCLRRPISTYRPLYSKQTEELPAQEESAALEEYDAEPVDIQTELQLPPEIMVAPRPEEITDSSYVPADNAEGLEEVGGLADYWETQEHWNPSVEIRGFGPFAKVTDPAVLQVCARRAVVEAVAVRDSTASAENKPSLTGLWERGGQEEQTQALGLQIEVAESGAASLKGDAEGVVKGLTWDPEAEASPAAEASIEASEAQELLQSWDASWKRISLEDPAFKFAVTKRIQQLTGHLLPDAKLASVRNVGALLGVLIAPPKPKKLADEIIANGELVNLPNVTVHARRVTPIDKEQAVGRWKVIVEELQKRDLPVTGTAGYGKPIEKRWATGQV